VKGLTADQSVAAQNPVTLAGNDQPVEQQVPMVSAPPSQDAAPPEAWQKATQWVYPYQQTVTPRATGVTALARENGLRFHAPGNLVMPAPMPQLNVRYYYPHPDTAWGYSQSSEPATVPTSGNASGASGQPSTPGSVLTDSAPIWSPLAHPIVTEQPSEAGPSSPAARWCRTLKIGDYSLVVQPRTQLVIPVKWSEGTPPHGDYLFEPGQRLVNQHGLMMPKCILSPDGLRHSLITVFNPTDRYAYVQPGTMVGVAKPL
jgi:hypothetical protein